MQGTSFGFRNGVSLVAARNYTDPVGKEGRGKVIERPGALAPGLPHARLGKSSRRAPLPQSHLITIIFRFEVNDPARICAQ